MNIILVVKAMLCVAIGLSLFSIIYVFKKWRIETSVIKRPDPHRVRTINISTLDLFKVEKE